MRKVKLQMQISVDGYVAGPNNEMDWMQWDWDDELKKYVYDLTNPVDCILLGRKLAEGFIPTWKSRIANPETADDFGRKMVSTPKVVFSESFGDVAWENTRLATGSITEEVEQLRQQEGGDIITYGGSGFAMSLIENNLIDEYHLFVNPAAIGNGMRIFSGRTDLKLVNSKAFDCGIVLLHYAPAGK